MKTFKSQYCESISKNAVPANSELLELASLVSEQSHEEVALDGCVGTAGTLGTAGTFGGTAGTFGTAGTYACG